MTAKCDKCDKRFDSHDGGTICRVCDKVFCPKCEPKHFADDNQICNACAPGSKAITPLPADMLHTYKGIYKVASKVLARDGNADPVAFLRVGSQILIVALDLSEDKDLVADMLREVVKRTKPDMVLTVLESWLTQPTEADIAYYKKEGCFPTTPSKHPNRQEIVLFSIQTPEQVWTVNAPILRDAQKRPSLAAEPPLPTAWESAGRFGNLFHPERDLPA